jgi:uncharacterized protein YndB with AHSA1/START domain
MSPNTASSPSLTATPVKELNLTRVFKAPRSLVFKVWTEAEHLAKWWGPHHFTNTVHKFDARPGGAIRIDMRGPDGTVYPMGGMFEEIEEPHRLVFTTTALDATTGTVYLKLQNIVTFTEHNGRTTMTLHAAVTEATPEGALALKGMEAGWTQSIERLHALLQNYLKDPSSMNHNAFSTGTEDREITGSRIFNAPRELVFKMWTDPEHIVNWWGPTGFRNTIFEMDVRPGGKWRHIMHGPDGVDYKNESIYLEIVPQERLVYQHVSAPGHISTVTFEDLGNKTKVSMHMLFETAEIRDTTVKVFNAIEGLQQTLQRLADQLAVAIN